MKTSKILVAAILLFLLGIVSGSVGTHLYLQYKITHFMERDHPSRSDLLLGRLTRDLDLTAAQQERVRRALRDSSEKIREIDRRTRPEIQETVDDTFRQIRAGLDKGQQKKFDKFRKRFEKKRRHRLFPPPPRSPHKKKDRL